MQKKIFILVIFLASLIQAQEQNSTIKNQISIDKLSMISVTIGGSFIVTGSFPASSTERIDQFITRIFNEARNIALNTTTDETAQAKLQKQIAKYAKRDIILKRIDGTRVNIDLEKFRLTGDFQYNPYLKNDDVIIFPEWNDEVNCVYVSGAVNFPTKFQLVDGDKLQDALLFARGINPAYDNVNEVEIYRLDNTGNKEEIIKAGINDVVQLKAGDRVKVLSDENNKKDFKVLVLGEVKNPGYVFVKKNGISIKELIDRTGGFTAYASVENAELLRGINSTQSLKMKFVKEQFEKNPDYKITKFDSKLNYQNIEALLTARTANLSVEDSLNFNMDNMLRVLFSPGIVDFTKINDTSSKEGSFIVKDGDVVIVPEKENLVYLFGQVKNAGYIEYKPGMNYKYYISQAGGETDASNGDVKIIKSKSRSWTDAEDDTAIDAGDMIYITKDISHKWYYYLTQAGSLASIATGLISMIYFFFIAK